MAFDGVRETDANNMLTKLYNSGDMKTYKQLIRFKLNEDYKIISIDTAAKTENEMETSGSLFCSVSYNGESTYFFTLGKFFHKKPLMDRNTLVFVVPDETDNDESDRRFKIKDQGFFTTAEGNYISAYKTDLEYPYVPFIVARSKTTTVVESNSPIFIIDNKQKVLNDEGDVVTRIDGYSKTAAKTIYVSDDVNADELSKGDVIRAALDVDDYLLTYQKVFDYSEGGGIISDNGSKSYMYKVYSPNALFNMKYAYVVDKYVNDDTSHTDNVANIPKNVLFLGYEDSAVCDEEWMVTSNNIVIYDSETDEMYMGTVNDVISYKASDRGTKMLIWTVYGENRMQIAYR